MLQMYHQSPACLLGTENYRNRSQKENVELRCCFLSLRDSPVLYQAECFQSRRHLARLCCGTVDLRQRQALASDSKLCTSRRSNDLRPVHQAFRDTCAEPDMLSPGLLRSEYQHMPRLRDNSRVASMASAALKV